MQISNIQEFKSINTTKTYLLILNALRTPPHLAFICNGLFYSLSVFGTDYKIPYETILKTIEIKHTPTLFFELNVPENTEVIIEKTFSNLQSIEVEKSCFAPIKKVISHIFNLNTEANYIFELLPYLFENKHINSIFSKNLILENNTFGLKKYSFEDINMAIKELRNRG